MLIYIFLLISITITNAIQGYVSIGSALRAQKQLDHYLNKYQLELKENITNLQNLSDFDEFSTMRYISKCQICNKTFKNSTMLQLHQYKSHFNEETLTSIIKLTYFCEFTHCLITFNSTHHFNRNVRMAKCLKFGLDFAVNNINNYEKINMFCEDILLDQKFILEVESSLSIFFSELFQYLLFAGYIAITILILKSIYSFIQFLKKRHKKINKSQMYNEQYHVQ